MSFLPRYAEASRRWLSRTPRPRARRRLPSQGTRTSLFWGPGASVPGRRAWRVWWASRGRLRTTWCGAKRRRLRG
eukprot:scaffold1253_cov245-Pinguiococcus_pyrenoidosus.AAC.23